MIELTILGTTAGIPTKERGHSALALRYEGEILLFDCGENTQRQLANANLSPMKISSIFLTHWHADHFAGLPGLVQSLSLQGRERTLHIYGPRETKKFVRNLLAVGYFTKTFDVKVHEVRRGGGLVLKKPKYSVLALEVKHKIPTLAYKFAEAEKPGRFDVKKARKLGLKPIQFGELQRGKSVKVKSKTIKPSKVMGPARKGLSIVYSGDTLYYEPLVNFAEGCDLLIHEATFADEMKKEAKMVGHTTAKQAAQIAKKAKVKRLILTHISGRYRDARPLLNEAKKVFRNTEIAKDGMQIVLK